jgi:hypothetical protein
MLALYLIIPLIHELDNESLVYQNAKNLRRIADMREHPRWNE